MQRRKSSIAQCAVESHPAGGLQNQVAWRLQDCADEVVCIYSEAGATLVRGSSMLDEFLLERYSTKSFSSRLHFSLPASIEAIANTEEAVMSFAEHHGCNGDALLELRLALQEALANAVVHGCKQDETQTVQGLVACDDNGSILIAVRDPGQGFDFRTTALPGEQDADHGRGVELMRRLVDELHFERNGAEVHLLKRCPLG